MSEEIKTNELRRYAIMNRTEVTFRVSGDGSVAVMNRNGILNIPHIQGAPPYNTEEVLARADKFSLHPEEGKQRTVTRAEMAALLSQPN